MKTKCMNCGEEIIIDKRALELCSKCFNERCVCGHKRAMHVDNDGSCIHEYNLNHKTKRGEFCGCKEFKNG